MSRPAGSYFLSWDLVQTSDGLHYVVDVYGAPDGGRWAERRLVTWQEARDMDRSPYQGGRRRL